MKILGISYMYHDSAAVLLVDGRLVAAAAEERFNRLKHSIEFPEQAARYCLRQGGLDVSELDCIGFYEKPLLKFERFLTAHMAYFPRSYTAFRRFIPLFLTRKLHIPGTIRESLDYRGDIFFAEHHPVHAASAFYPSPFDRAAILTVDGTGEWATTCVGLGEGDTIRLLRELRWPHSIGLLYSALTAYLGFRVNGGEGKVMGLAPYGDPERFIEPLRRLSPSAGDGSFRLDLSYFDFHYKTRMVSPKFEQLFGTPREPEGPIEEHHRDVAAALQLRSEELLLEISRHAYESTGATDLCIAGGVGLNSVANGRILRETPFERIFVQPASGDDGGALGAALYLQHHLFGDGVRVPMEHACWGPEFGDAEIAAFLARQGIAAQALEEADLLERCAGALAQGHIVGWFQGRMEYGPRALGNRSILADPRGADMKDVLNARVKHRESFRPFAPAVPLERVAEFFDLEGPSPYMLLVAAVRDQWVERLPAITHVDGTARVQTVTPESNRLFYRLLEAFERHSGVPVLLNTSFNVRGEPIVCSPEDAWICFQKTDMDALVLGRWWIDAQREAQQRNPSSG